MQRTSLESSVISSNLAHLPSEQRFSWSGGLLWTARICLLLVTLALPWAFGGVDAFSQYLMCPLLLAALLSGGLAELIDPRVRTAAGWPLLLTLVVLLMGGSQVLDVGRPVVETFSPRVAQLRSELVPAPDAPLPTISDLQPIHTPETLSVYAPATRRETVLLLCGMSVLLMGFRWFRSSAALQFMAVCLVLNGGAIAYFALVQKLSWNGQLYWSIPIEVATPFGPFVNRNSGGGFLVICLAALFPLLSGLPWMQGTGRRPSDYGSGRSIGYATLTYLAMGGLMLCGLLASMSRGAWLGALVGLLVWLLWMGRRAWKPRTFGMLAGGALVAVSLLTWLSLTDQIHSRVTDAIQSETSLGGRTELWREVLLMIPDFWSAGSGLGTFGLVQPIYQTRPMLIWYDQAENLFLQALVEAGVAGFVFLALLVVLCTRDMHRLSLQSGEARDLNIASLGIFLVVSQTVCASFDFGLRYPANQFTLALLMGAALGHAAARREAQPNFSGRSRVGSRWLSSLAVPGLLLVIAAGWWELAWSGGVELVLNRGQSEQSERELTATDRDDEIAALTALLTIRPDDAEGHQRLAELQVLAYREAAFEALQVELADAPDISENELWNFTSPMVLHRQAAEFARTGQLDFLEELRQQSLVQQHLIPAVRSAYRARQWGPFLYRPHQLLGQLSFLQGDPFPDQAEIHRTVLLLPQHPNVRFWAGLMHWQADRITEALPHWRRCLELTDGHDKTILDLAASRLSPAEIIAELVPEDLSVAVRLAMLIADRTDLAPLQPLMGEQLLKLAEGETTTGPTAGLVYFARASGYELTGRLDEAIEELRAAITVDPLEIAWRVKLAELLFQSGAQVEAVREAEVAVRLQPDNAHAQAVRKELISRTLSGMPPQKIPAGDDAQ